jgi:hypothetical protein
LYVGKGVALANVLFVRAQVLFRLFSGFGFFPQAKYIITIAIK